MSSLSEQLKALAASHRPRGAVKAQIKWHPPTTRGPELHIAFWALSYLQDTWIPCPAEIPHFEGMETVYFDQPALGLRWYMAAAQKLELAGKPSRTYMNIFETATREEAMKIFRAAYGIEATSCVRIADGPNAQQV